MFFLEYNDPAFEFLNPNAKTVVVFNKAITAFDVKECIKHCIMSDFWPRDSSITILAGHHTSEEGMIKGSFSAFLSSISKHVEDLKTEDSVVENYNFNYVPIFTVPTGKDSNGDMLYELAGLSLDNLKMAFRNALRNEDPDVLIFATCFSKKSEINCLIDACGLYPALFLSADRGLMSDGRCFQLDKQQRSILDTFAKVSKKSYFQTCQLIFHNQFFYVYRKEFKI